MHHRAKLIAGWVCGLCLSVAAAVTAIAFGPVAHARAADGWQATAALGTPRADHTATLLPDGRVLVAGGLSGEPLTAPLGSAELYDPSAGKWTVAAPMAAARTGHTATLLTGPGCALHCGKVLVVGGSVAQDQNAPGVEVTPTAELYDPATGAWTPTGPLATGRTLHTASLLHGTPCEGVAPPAWCGKVLVAGGQPGGTSTELASAELFDPATGQWTATGPLATARRGHTVTMLRDGTVLAVGGRSDATIVPDSNPDPTLSSAERYDPGTGTWAAAGNTIIRRYRHTATLMSDGRVLVVGGLDFVNPARRSAEIYDPLSQADPWPGTPVTPAMAEGRASHTATPFPDGSLLVVGGRGQDLDRRTTERYRPASGWSYDASLGTGRERHTATLLTGPGCGPNCGKLLVAGGLRLTTTAIASVELYGALPPPAPAPPSSDVPPARSVTDLAARALSSRRISLTFSAPSPSGDAARPATRYVVKQSRSAITQANFAAARSLCGGTCTFAPERAGDRVTLEVGDLVPDRRYHYALAPLDGAGRRGTLSNVAQVRTAKDTLRPGRPRRPSARAAGSGRIRLSFRAPASDGRAGPPVRRYVVKQATRPIRGARGFRRARSLCRSSCRFAPSRVGSRVVLTVRRLCSGRRYHYAIRALDEGGNLSRIVRFRVVRARGPRGARC